jgi:hypothetical protein
VLHEILGRGGHSVVYRAAIADYGQALERNPADTEAWLSSGDVRTNWANYRSSHGQDPTEQDAPRRVGSDGDRALRLAP